MALINMIYMFRSFNKAKMSIHIPLFLLQCSNIKLQNFSTKSAFRNSVKNIFLICFVDS